MKQFSLSIQYSKLITHNELNVLINIHNKYKIVSQYKSAFFQGLKQSNSNNHTGIVSVTYSYGNISMQCV